MKYYTSAEANKMLKAKEDELRMTQMEESSKSSFLCAVGENEDVVRPDYSFEDTNNRIEKLQGEIREIKHAINVFNSNTVVEDYEAGISMAIDQLLVYLPQLSDRKLELFRLASALPRTRVSHTPNVIDYEVANYDIADAKREYEKVSYKLARAQMALDKTNNSIREIGLNVD